MLTKHARAARQSATYFQFPLSALAFGKSDQERLEAVISFGLVEAGRKRWNKLAPAERERILNTATHPRDFDRQRESHGIALCGAEVTNVTVGSMRSCLARHEALKEFCNAVQHRHGPDASVRLKSSLVFEAREGKGITPCELWVLAARHAANSGPICTHGSTPDLLR